MKGDRLLTDWIKLKHAGQVKKYSGEAYFVHLLHVAEAAKDATESGYEIGLCHDLLEDTGTTAAELHSALLEFGYDEQQATYVTARVVELTDRFTAAAYPALSREGRKARETERLTAVSAGAQTVKCADLIDNMAIVIHYAPAYAATYLRKKELLLKGMVLANHTLRKNALQLIQDYFNNDDRSGQFG